MTTGTVVTKKLSPIFALDGCHTGVGRTAHDPLYDQTHL